MSPTKQWPLHENLGCSGSSLFWCGPNLAVEKYIFHKRPFLTITSPMVNRNCSPITGPTNCWTCRLVRKTHIQILSSRCLGVCASQSTCWFESSVALKDWRLFPYVWFPSLVTTPPLPPRTKQHQTFVNGAKYKKHSVRVTKADILEQNLDNDKLNPKGLSKISDTSDQTFSSLWKGTQK